MTGQFSSRHSRPRGTAATLDCLLRPVLVSGDDRLATRRGCRDALNQYVEDTPEVHALAKIRSTEYQPALWDFSHRASVTANLTPKPAGYLNALT